MGFCQDCGCRTSGGVCSNCQEELYIIENQYEYIDQPLSAGFQKKAKEQKQYLKERKRLK
jgi:hypothetical protein